MEIKDTPGNNEGWIQKNIGVVLAVLALSCICLVSVIGAPLWGINDLKKTVLANATSTAFSIATQSKNVTVTAVARSTEQAGYEFIESFDEVSARWYVGPHPRQYGDATYSIRDGVYIWDIRNSSTFFFWKNFYKGNKIKDFDAYLDTRFVESESQGAVCAGLAFRRVEGDWNKGTFAFGICNDAHFQIQYYDRDGWREVSNSNFIDFIQVDDWNRLEVSARGDQFVFRINNMDVFEMTDDRLQQGSLGIYLVMPANESALVWFDNFGYQSR